MRKMCYKGYQCGNSEPSQLSTGRLRLDAVLFRILPAISHCKEKKNQLLWVTNALMSKVQFFPTVNVSYIKVVFLM